MNTEKLLERQKEIAKEVKLIPFKEDIKTIAGIDISFRGDEGNCCIIVLNFNSMQEIEKVEYKAKANFPYISGFLAFREGPIILKAIKNLKTKVDIFMFDGQGISHPRRCGIASHMGVIINKPTIGVAKSHLYGHYTEPENKKFSFSYIFDYSNKKIGAVLRSKENCKPIFVSPGHLTDIESSIRIVKKCLKSYRLPEPTRLAHIISKAKSDCSSKICFAHRVRE